MALVNINTADLGVPGVAWLTLTDEAAGQIGADTVISASSRSSAFVHINTASRYVGGVVGPSERLTELEAVSGRCRAPLARRIPSVCAPAERGIPPGVVWLE